MKTDVKTKGSQPLHEQFLQLRAAAFTRREAPVEVSFSDLGYMEALRQDDAHFGHVGPTMRPKSYMGLPFVVDPAQADMMQLRCVPGGSEEAREFRNSRRAADEAIAGNNTGRAQMLLGNESTLALLGQAATEAQLCDLIMARVNAKAPDQLTPLERALSAAVEAHGRFE